MKRILFITRGRKKSGTETWREGLTKLLRDRGYEVAELDGTSVRSLLGLKETVRSDVIHGYHASGLTPVVMLLGKLSGKKVVYTLHGNYFEEVKSKTGIKKLLLVPMHDYFLSLADVVTFPSRFLLDRITSKRADVRIKSTVIPNGINLNGKIIVKKEDRVKKLLMVTNFNYKDKARGIVPAISAFNRVVKEVPDLVLEILGDGKYLKHYQQLYQDKKVRFLGHRRAEEFIRNCDLFIHSTYLDNLPYVILEAMGNGRPVITVPTGGIPEMVDESSITELTAEGLYRKIKSFVTDREIRDGNIEMNNRKIKGFRWNRLIKDYERIYEN